MCNPKEAEPRDGCSEPCSSVILDYPKTTVKTTVRTGHQGDRGKRFITHHINAPPAPTPGV